MQIAGCSADRQQTQNVNAFQMSDMGHHGMRNGHRIERKMDAPVCKHTHTHIHTNIHIYLFLCYF